MILNATEQYLLDLLAIPSESGQEQAIIQKIEQDLQTDFSIQRIPVGDGRYNLLCLKGEPEILLAAHVDTVPGQLPVSCDEENIYGRGSCDNKGAAAAMISAAREAISNGKTNFGLLFTVGEETIFDGAIAVEKYFKEKSMTPNRIVIGEPTDLQIVTAQRGIYGIELTCTGTQEHSSVDQPDSAIHKLVQLLDHLLETVFDETTFHVGSIVGGIADNVVAPIASAQVLFRSAHEDIAQQVQTILDAVTIPYTLKVTHALNPVDHTTPPFEKHSVSYFTEMTFLQNSFVLGPGSIKDAHSKNEKVSRKELNEVVNMYLAFLEKK